MGQEKQVNYVKTELVKCPQRQRRIILQRDYEVVLYACTALPAVNHTKRETSRRVVFVDELKSI